VKVGFQDQTKSRLKSQVSDEDTYYAIIKRKLDAEVFAYGAGGFGTLQEYMILDRYVDMIHPSLILWQFCLNDFITTTRHWRLPVH